MFRPDKAFKGTVVNQQLQSLLIGSLEIMLTVPLNEKILKKEFDPPKPCLCISNRIIA